MHKACGRRNFLGATQHVGIADMDSLGGRQIRRENLCTVTMVGRLVEIQFVPLPIVRNGAGPQAGPAPIPCRLQKANQQRRQANFMFRVESETQLP